METTATHWSKNSVKPSKSRSLIDKVKRPMGKQSTGNRRRRIVIRRWGFHFHFLERHWLVPSPTEGGTWPRISHSSSLLEPIFSIDFSAFPFEIDRWTRNWIGFTIAPHGFSTVETSIGFFSGYLLAIYWLLLAFPGFHWALLGISWVLPGFTGFYRVLQAFIWFYWVLWRFTGFYWVLQGFMGFYWVLLCFTGF